MIRTSPSLLLAGLLLASFIAAPAALAQPAGVTGRGSGGPGGPGTEPGTRLEFSAAYSGSSATEFTGPGRPGGDLAVSDLSARIVATIPFDAGTNFSVGATWQAFLIDTPAGTPVPKTLTRFTLDLGASYTLAPAWRLAWTISPGFFSEGTAWDADTANVTGLVTATYAPSRELLWAFGVRVDPFSNLPVLPLAGVRWQFAPEWTLNLLFPRPAMEWRASPTLTFSFGAELSGGNYRVADDFGTKSGRTGLNHALLDFTAWSAGPGFRLAISDTVTLSGGVGYLFQREFEFHRVDFTVKTDDTWSARLALSGRF